MVNQKAIATVVTLISIALSPLPTTSSWAASADQVRFKRCGEDFDCRRKVLIQIVKDSHNESQAALDNYIADVTLVGRVTCDTSAWFAGSYANRAKGKRVYRKMKVARSEYRKSRSQFRKVQKLAKKYLSRRDYRKFRRSSEYKRTNSLLKRSGKLMKSKSIRAVKKYSRNGKVSNAYKAVICRPFGF